MDSSASSKKHSEKENPYSQNVDEVLRSFKTDPEKGLSDDEAEKRLDTYGRNQLKKQKQKSLFEILIDQINNPIVYLLTAAAVLAFVFGDIPEGIAIVVVLILNTMIGFWMEFQARKSMNALQ